jgi:hypothetical protein
MLRLRLLVMPHHVATGRQQGHGEHGSHAPGHQPQGSPATRPGGICAGGVGALGVWFIRNIGRTGIRLSLPAQ